MKIGITGHQQLENAEWVGAELLKILRSHEAPLRGITSLAKGADQLFAEAVLECGGKLEVIVPFEGYADEFDEQARRVYQRLLAQASGVDTLPGASSNEESYLCAGKTVVDRASLMIAVWDGKPAGGLGGTADIVAYAQQRSKPFIQINPESKTVI